MAEDNERVTFGPDVYAPRRVPPPRFNGPDGDPRTPTRRQYERNQERAEASMILGAGGVGAAAGTMVFPGIGTVVGGAGGLLVGAVGTVLNRQANASEYVRLLPGEAAEMFRGNLPTNASVAQPTPQAQENRAGSQQRQGIADIIRELTQSQGEEDPRQYLGLPPDAHVGPASRLPDGVHGPVPKNTPAQRYTTSSPVEQFARLSPERRLQVQNQLARAGLITDDLVDGRVTPETLAALTTVMSLANLNGTTWTDALRGMETHAVDAKKTAALDAWNTVKDGFVREAYLAPSYETMAQAVKGEMRRQLGRDPKDWEIELLSEELSASARAAYEQNLRVDENDYLRRAAMQINAEAGEDFIAAPEALEGEEQVDPAALFAEKFDELYGGEREDNEQEQVHSETSQRVIQGLTSIDGLFS